MCKMISSSSMPSGNAGSWVSSKACQILTAPTSCLPLNWIGGEAWARLNRSRCHPRGSSITERAWANPQKGNGHLLVCGITIYPSAGCDGIRNHWCGDEGSQRRHLQVFRVLIRSETAIAKKVNPCNPDSPASEHAKTEPLWLVSWE